MIIAWRRTQQQINLLFISFDFWVIYQHDRIDSACRCRLFEHVIFLLLSELENIYDFC